jgi:hypothetical protein
VEVGQQGLIAHKESRPALVRATPNTAASITEKGSFTMKARQLKVLILFLVLAFAAFTLAGWTWDDGAALSASVAQQSL